MWFTRNSRKTLVNWLMQPRKQTNFPMCDFDALKHEVRSGDVLLIEGTSRMSGVVKHLTTSHWSHSALYLGRLHDIEDPDLRRMIKSHIDTSDSTQLLIEGFLGKGIVISKLSKYDGEHIRICRPKGLSHHDAQVVLGHAIRSVGVKYNVRNIIDLARFLLPWRLLPRRWGSTLFRRRGDNDDREICSSLIAEAFEQVNFPILPVVSDSTDGKVVFSHRNSRLYVPSDFDYSPYFEIIKYPMMSKLPTYRALPWEEK